MPQSPARSGSRSDPTSPYDLVVFSGGGCRCFWQAGFWESSAALIGISPRIVLGVSAGAAMACAALSGAIRSVVEDFKRRCAANARNAYPANAFDGVAVFPHERIYRATIANALDQGSFERLRNGPDLRMLLARPPRSLGPRTGVALAVAAHVLDRWEKEVHARWGKRFGFRPEVVSVRSCQTADELTDLILHSSCSPPLVPLYWRDGRIVLDGGVVDNAPVDLSCEAESALVLLSRDYGEAKIPRLGGRTYVQPSRQIPVQKWDYTNPMRIQQTYDLGRSDGEAFAKSLRSASWH